MKNTLLTTWVSKIRLISKIVSLRLFPQLFHLKIDTLWPMKAISYSFICMKAHICIDTDSTFFISRDAINLISWRQAFGMSRNLSSRIKVCPLVDSLSTVKCHPSETNSVLIRRNYMILINSRGLATLYKALSIHKLDQWWFHKFPWWCVRYLPTRLPLNS